MDDSERPERPPPDADAAEIAEWMEKDFGWALAEGAANAVDEDDSDDEHEVVEVEILNHERGEVVGTIDTDGNLDSESDALKHPEFNRADLKPILAGEVEIQRGKTHSSHD